MAARQLLIDISRTANPAFVRAPTGIPRVELAYAEHFIATAPDEVRFVVCDALGRPRVVGRKAGLALIAAITRYWRGRAGSRTAYLGILLRVVWLHVVVLLDPAANPARMIAAHRGRSVFVILSHLYTDRPRVLVRLKRGGDLAVVYFVHDIIPTRFPEYLPAGYGKQYRRLMEGAARDAEIIVVNSRDTAEQFRLIYGRDRAPGSIVVAPLGLNVAAPAASASTEAPVPYFVILGTIEPRKNHLLLLHLWRELHAEKGDTIPRLVVIGNRGWENDAIVDLLERSRALGGVVEELGAVSDEEMVRVLAGARALLMPSFAEGYGLPVAEALTLGTPVLCSDLPVFRETGGAVPEFLDPLDGPAWRAAILDYAGANSTRRQAQLERLAGWRPPTWKAHFAAIAPSLESGHPSGT